jgi:hypothetical protein
VVHWLVTGAALVIALVALARARSLGRRLERLTQHYWELRYQHGELRAHVRRLDPETAREDEPAPPPAQAGTFIPLSALKR